MLNDNSVTRYWSEMCPKCFQNCPSRCHSSFYIKRSFSKSFKSHQCFWATFARKFVAENLQKSPNLVTLNVNYLGHETTIFYYNQGHHQCDDALRYLCSAFGANVVKRDNFPPLPDLKLKFNLAHLLAVVVAQLVEWSLPTQEVRGSNPKFILNNFYCQLYLKDDNKEKRCWVWPILKKPEDIS